MAASSINIRKIDNGFLVEYYDEKVSKKGEYTNTNHRVFAKNLAGIASIAGKVLGD